jgi:hypothetical protein
VGIAPPPGLSQGIPIPPFGRPQPQAAPPPKQSAQQQTIKVEIGEEIHAERKKWRTRIALGAIAGAAIGLGIGFVAGGSSEKGDRAASAARGAGLLAVDVQAANEKLKELDAKLTEAGDKIKTKAYPEDMSNSLAGLTIPFDETNLDGKSLNGMTAKNFRMVNDYTNSCKAVNKLREKLKNVAAAAKDAMNKVWKEETTPVANYSVIFRTESGKVVGDIVPTVGPFEWKKEFPEKYKISKLEGRAMAEKEVKRYQKGDLPGNDLTAIPLDPKTTGVLSADANVRDFASLMIELRKELTGTHDNPTTETPGLLKIGEDLAVELKKACELGLNQAQCKDLMAKKK